MIIKRLIFSFITAAVISLGIAALGLISTTKVDNALIGVIGRDLPASDHLGQLGRQLMTIQSSLNALLNPNLAMEQRQSPHAAYLQARDELNRAMEGFDEYIQAQRGNPGLAQVTTDWREIEGVSRQWLAVADQIVGHYRQWEETRILNPTALLMNLEKYRADHYFLVRRLSEMIGRGQVSGAEVGSNAGLCAFGRWQTAFDSGTDPLSGNAAFRSAMDKMRAPHGAFHATAAEIYRLVQSGSRYNQGRIQDEYLKLLNNADQVIANFETMIKEAGRAQAIYQEAAGAVSDKLLPLSDRLQNDLNLLMANKRAYDRENNQATVDQGQRFIMVMALGAGLTLVLLVTLSALVLRSIRRAMSTITDSLNEAARQVDQSSGQLSTAANSLADGATENAASLEETSAALEELSSMTRRNADNASEANSLMTQATAAVDRADSSMSGVIEAMGEISTSGNEISKIIKTIDEIAFQTNLLALNAAVEAARAGEAGSGFAVVADEVRNLAIRSAEAAKSTADLIAATIGNINSGSAMVQTTAEAFQTVSRHSGQVAELLAEVAEASKEQAQGIDQITTAMNRMDKVTQTTAASAEESASAAGQLSDQAGQLLRAVTDLRALVYARKSGEVPHRPQLPPSPARPAAGRLIPPRLGHLKPADDSFDF